MRGQTFPLGASLLLAATVFTDVTGQDRSAQLDATVQAFLERRRGTWRDLNVPESDGRALHELIVKHKFTRALEIGTSTGHFWPKVVPGGCFTAHNVSGLFAGAGIRQFLAHLETLPDATTIDKSSREGISITCKKR